MSKSIFAKQFDNDYEYEAAKRQQRKADRQKRDIRKTKRDNWMPRED